MSVPLTGFSPEDLYATGMVEEYQRTLIARIGAQRAADLYRHYRKKKQEANAKSPVPDELPWPTATDDPILADAARAVVKMWYVGAWYGLSPAAEAKLREAEKTKPQGVAPNEAFMVSPEAYLNGLVWKVSGGHPPGGKPPGYGSWQSPPVPIPAPATGSYEELS
ncbi:hypothetical protein FCH28_13540 [Streptomyces piniterrae]|uniref:Uncharacterized protein n=2 Tax=Streptomyces piniterrae TaxID=2571125 RepID=A0A4V5MMU1_9ACTN|nr:hypothetical protein FCH28_13540 [Streptomyces piniterrae]